MSDPRIDRIAARWSAAQTVARVTVDDLLADLPDDPYDNVVVVRGHLRRDLQPQDVRVRLAHRAQVQGVVRGIGRSTNGAWVQITASTSRAYRGVVLCPTSSDSGMSAGYVGFDLGVGGAGAEVAHLGSATYQTTSIEELRPATGGSTFIPAEIPSGSRLAVRVIDSLIVSNTGYSAVLIGVP